MARLNKGTSAQMLLESDWVPETPRQMIKQRILSRLAELKAEGVSGGDLLQALFPTTILDDEILEQLTSALLAGNHLLLIGPPGSGKTNLAKDVYRLFPRTFMAVDGCPVQDNPSSIVSRDFHHKVPACPYCKVRFGGDDSDEALGRFDPDSVDPARVPVVEADLREGFGYARVQGSPEVFPDNLTGTVNLRRLEEVGDPNSPLVLEPGKLLQANRGVLLLDEVGKLPRGTQNVLLQALQESIVTPARSRETFPASFIAITTSNLDDLDNINEPLNDRLTNIFVDFSHDLKKNRKIVDINLQAGTALSAFVPTVYIDAAVYLTQRWRKTSGQMYDLTEVGSNRTMIEIVRRAHAYTELGNNPIMSTEDFTRGSLDAMRGRIRARGGDSYHENRALVEGFVAKNLRDSLLRAGTAYWCNFFKDELNSDKSEGKRILAEVTKLVKAGEAEGLMGKNTNYPKFTRFGESILGREIYRGDADDDLVAFTVTRILTDLDTFSCED